MKAMQTGAAILAAVALAPLTLSGCGNNDEVTEPSTNGSISILTSTSGGIVSGSYIVRVDDAMERSVEPNGSVTYSDVAPGEYQVILLSVPSNCNVEGLNPRSLSVTADNISRTTFLVTCSNEPQKPGEEPPPKV